MRLHGHILLFACPAPPRYWTSAGERARGLTASKWASRFRIGVHGCRRLVVDTFKADKRQSHEWGMSDLSGVVLARPCHAREPCRVDVFISSWCKFVGNAVVDLDGATSDEDHQGNAKQK